MPSSERQSRDSKVGLWIVKYGGVSLGVVFIVVWIGVVLSSGWGFNLTGVNWDFERTGQLGDSFGVLSSVMAAIAAYFAFRTYRSARDDVARLERQAAEPSFLNLIERRYDVLDRVRLQYFDSERGEYYQTTGQALLDQVANELRTLMGNGSVGADAYHAATDQVNGLPNLYRFTYHIVAFARDQFSLIGSNDPMIKDDPAYQFVRLLRAQLSNSELLLLAHNCAFGRGREKFKPLLERYALLHNMDPRDVERFHLNDIFEDQAFGLYAEDRVEALSEVILAREKAAVAHT